MFRSNEALQIGCTYAGANGVDVILVLGIARKDTTVRGDGITYDQLALAAHFVDDSIAIVADRVIIAHPTDIGTSVHLAAQHDLVALRIEGF